MRSLARLFSLLFLLSVLAVGALVVWPRLFPPTGPSVVLPSDLPPLVGTIDRIVVEKSARRMTIFQGDQAMRVYRVALGFKPSGDKQRQGDGRTPEGSFKINRRNDASAYHLSLGIDYPQPDDIARATEAGFDPGGDIFFHGQPNSLAGQPALPGDWTAGCIALTDAEIREIWAVTPMGTTVEIRP